MNLKAIKLPHGVISTLYTNKLVAGQGTMTNEKIDAPAPEVPSEAGYSYLGNNEKKVLIIVSNPGVDYLTEDDMAFLKGMLSACKLSLQDVAIFNTGNLDNFSYLGLVRQLETRVVLLINTTASAIGLPLDFPYYQVQPFSNMTFLASPALSVIKNDPLEKSKLWVCLRRIFNV
jgi:hypothetical protein